MLESVLARLAIGMDFKNVRPMDHEGVGGGQIYRAQLNGSPVIIKTGVQIGTLETRSARLLKKYGLPVLDSRKNGNDYVVYPDLKATRKGGSLHELIVNPGLYPNINQDEIIKKYIRLHRKMWRDTNRDASKATKEFTPNNIVGYKDKIQDTFSKVLQVKMKFENGQITTVEEMVKHNWVINGIKVGNLNEILELISRKISDGYKEVCMTHGDEGFGNCLVGETDFVRGGKPDLFVIDPSSAGWRSHYESMAKILGWFDAVTSKALSYNISNLGNNVVLNTQTTLPDNSYKAILKARTELDDLITTQDQKTTLAAFLAMYYLRELNHAIKRGRSEALPYLFARALSFVPEISNPEHRTFPLDLDKQMSVGSEVLDKSHKVIKLTSEADLAGVMEQITEHIEQVRIFTFDVDNSLIVPGVKFPKESLSLLKSQFLTCVSTGAGFKSVERRLQKATGQKNLRFVDIFSGPIITEDGARVYAPRTEGSTLSPADLLIELEMSQQDIDGFIKSSVIDDSIEYSGFYPYSKNENESPFAYIFYVPEGKSNKKEIIKSLNERYDGNLTIADTLSEYYELMQQLHPTKIVISAKDENIIKTKKQLLEDQGQINAHLNEGYLNITNHNATKILALEKFAELVQEIYSFDSGIVSHFGNDENDLPALTSKLSFIVNSNKEKTDFVLEKLKKSKKTGLTVVVEPDLLNKLLSEIANLKSKMIDATR